MNKQPLTAEQSAALEETPQLLLTGERTKPNVPASLNLYGLRLPSCKDAADIYSSENSMVFTTMG